VVREPLRGNVPSLHDYLVCAACLVVAWALGMLVFSMIRPRIAALV
jgi:ABC-type polysaccharide/polyol phosphate export permease